MWRTGRCPRSRASGCRTPVSTRTPTATTSATIINWALPEDFYRDITARTVAIAKKYGKLSYRWLMGYYKQPKDWAQVARWVDIAAEAGGGGGAGAEAEKVGHLGDGGEPELEYPQFLTP